MAVTGLSALQVAPIAPVVSVAHAVLAGLATVTLTLTDKQGRVDSVEFQTQVGAGAPSAWTPDATVPYSASAAVNPGELTIIRWRVIGFDLNNAPNQVLLAGEEHFTDVAAGGLPAGSAGDLLAHDGSAWAAAYIVTDNDEVLIDDGNVVIDFP